LYLETCRLLNCLTSVTNHLVLIRYLFTINIKATAKGTPLKRQIYLATVLLFFILLTPATTGAQEKLALEVQLGFDAFYKTETWVPLWVTVTNQGASQPASLQILDDNTAFGASPILYSHPVELSAQSRKQFSLYMPLRGQRRLQVALVDKSGTVIAAHQTNIEPLNQDAFLAGVVASHPSLLNPLALFSTATGDRVAVAHLTPAELPTHPTAWNGLDLLVFNDVDTSRLTAGQQEALDSWLRNGGRLMVGGGPNAAQTLAGLSGLLPFSGVAMQTLPDPLPDFRQFVSGSLPQHGPYVAAVPDSFSGRVLAQKDNLPLLISSGRGLGRVDYFAFDLSLAPMDTVTANRRFYRQLLGQLSPQAGPLAARTDIREIRESLALIPEQALPRPMTVALYLAIYVLVLGPGNYFVLARLKRRDWAWVTIPIIILLFSSYGYFSGFRLRGGRPLLRQITVIQAQPGAAQARLDSFIGIYSPRRAEYTLEIDRNNVLVESLPASYSLNSQLTVTGGATTIIENLRGDIGGMPGIIARSYLPSPSIDASLIYRQAQNRLEGEIVNNTGQPITDAQLIIAGKLVNLGMLPPGSTPLNHTPETPTYSLFYQLQPTDDIDQQEALTLASRDMAIQAVIGLSQNSDALEALAGGPYLVGWQTGSPLPVNLTTSPGDQLEETLLLVSLPVAMN